jgi:pimeloyl-ACP methyl ester carboxylesterase
MGMRGSTRSCNLVLLSGQQSLTATRQEKDAWALDLKNAIHIGHSTGGGEVTRYAARHGKGRVAKAVIISSIPPSLLKSDKNPDGVPMEVFDGIRDGTANHRAQFYQACRRRTQIGLMPICSNLSSCKRTPPGE